ncbi:glycosyltransferase family A protein [Streptomyces sp. NPDC005706]|uniref:glycosyltransferase family 2 protein n=1 Tax=Streptomyces sp. NPDC005706 TaxID=3157169 RepID=UPI0033EF889E
MQSLKTCEVSVIVTCYNYGRFLRRALDSVLRQSFSDWEVIIVDDGSSDETREVLHKFMESHDQVRISTLHVRNGGLAKARNLGIALARGTYVTCLDADDSFAAHALDDMVAALRENESMAVVRPGMSIFEEVEHERRLLQVDIMPEYSLSDLAVENLAPYCSMFRWEAWQEVGGYDETMPAYEDWDFWLSLGERGHTMGRTFRSSLCYRLNRDGLLRSSRGRDLELRARIVRNHPQVYDEAAQDLAAMVLDGARVDELLTQDPHGIFKGSRRARELTSPAPRRRSTPSRNDHR